MNKLLFGLIAILLFQNSFGQSAWNLKENSWYTQFNYTRIGPYSDMFVNGNETAKTPREIEDNTFQLYVEYGINERTSLSFQLPLKLIKTGPQTTPTNPIIDENSVTSFGNIGFEVKRNLVQKGFVLSTGVGVEANTGTYDDASGIRTGYDAWTVTPGFYFGKSYNDLFLQGSIGVGFRTNNYSHFFRAGAEVGYKFINRIWGIFYFDYKKSFENGTIQLPENNISTFLYVDNKEYVGYGLKGIYELTSQFQFTAGFGGAFSANAEARKAALNLGLIMKIDPKKK